MRKLFATFMLLMFVSVAFVGTASSADEVVYNPNPPVCHDKDGKWDPQDKSCEQTCGCFFHQIEEFIVDLFE